MAGQVKLAGNPNPADKAVDVPRDASLSWSAGKFPAVHDVYLGKTFADVNSASSAKPAGVLVSQGQTATTYTPAAVFEYGQTYYWRIDEVNKSADGTIFKGNVWSFTAEPYGYPITSVTATASSSQPSMGPEKTINGSGLTGDLHGTDGTTMWMSTGVQPNWIQYQFDKTYKLDKLLVWNSNQTIEGFLGFGAKDVKIEYSTDGTTWTATGECAAVRQSPRYAGLRRQHHRQLRRRDGQVRQADDQQHLGRHEHRDQSERSAVLLCPGPGPSAAAGDRRHGDQRRHHPELAARPRGGLAQGVLRHRCKRRGQRHRDRQDGHRSQLYAGFTPIRHDLLLESR